MSRCPRLRPVHAPLTSSSATARPTNSPSPQPLWSPLSATAASPACESHSAESEHAPGVHPRPRPPSPASRSTLQTSAPPPKLPSAGPSPAPAMHSKLNLPSAASPARSPSLPRRLKFSRSHKRRYPMSIHESISLESVLAESDRIAAEYAAAIDKAAGAAPVAASDPNTPEAPFAPTAIIGANQPRIDGPLKTTGRATYAADYNFPHLAYAVGVGSTVGAGTITSVDTSAAEKMPGVLLVMKPQNMGDILPANPNLRGGGNGDGRAPLSDDTVNYYGQFVAVAIADTFEQAQAAAAAIRVQYDAQKPNVSDDFFADEGVNMRTNSKRGDTDSAFASAPVKVDQVYSTPAETHNPMEMHASTAVWDGTNFTLYESSQSVMGFQGALAGALGVPRENVRIISRFIGSGFGGKLSAWPQSILAAAAARKLNRPVKMTVQRKLMFTTVGHRPATQQHVRLGATTDGKLVSLEHHYRNHTSPTTGFGENCGEATPFLYSTPNLTVTSGIVKRNVGAPCPMRGPGAVPGLYALESAMDELAIALKMDPVELRLRNDTLVDESSNNRPFSSRHYKECLQTGAERFGWSKRTPAVGSMRKGDLIYGWGVAGASWGAGA